MACGDAEPTHWDVTQKSSLDLTPPTCRLEWSSSLEKPGVAEDLRPLFPPCVWSPPPVSLNRNAQKPKTNMHVRQLEYARNNAASARASRDPSADRESLPPDPPLEAQNNALPATDATATYHRRCKASYASPHTPGDGRVRVGGTAAAAAWDDGKCCAAAGSSAGGQTDDTESSDGGGDGGRAGQTSGDFTANTNGTSRATKVPASGRAATTLEGEEVAVPVGGEASGSVAWEMLGAALRALEGVGQTGAEVLRQAKHAAGQVCVCVYVSF